MSSGTVKLAVQEAQKEDRELTEEDIEKEQPKK
jgi:hypothetical protein